MERAIFQTGQDAKPVEILNQVLSVPVVEKPEDVAQAIWDAVKTSGLRF